MKRRLTCPERGTLAEVETSEDPVDGRILGALSCTLLGGCGAVDCEQLCIQRLNRGLAARELLSRPARPARPPGSRRGKK